MWIRTISRAIVGLGLAIALSPVHAQKREELVTRLQAAGYSQVIDIKSTAEGTAVKAMKDGKPVRLVVDSSGQIKEQD